jgi:predicted phage terminase large subunit-like protein
VDEKGNWYVKAYGQKLDAKEIMEFIFNSNIAYKNLENIAIEETMFVEAIKPFYDEARRMRGQHPNLKFVKAGGRNKENRIRGLIPRMESGMLYFIEGECAQLEEQLLRFPRAKHDDVSDAVAYGNDVVKIPNFERIVQRSNGFYENETENTPFSSIGL